MARLRLFFQDWNSRTLTLEVFDRTAPLSRLIWLGTPLAPVPLCSGLGQCGRCRIRLRDTLPAPTPREADILGEEACARGERLSCCHTLAEFSLGDHGELDVLLDRHYPENVAPKQAASVLRAAVLAVDLGTTSLCWKSLPSGTAGQMLNPQIAAGSDVVSRLALARDPNLRHVLSQCVVTALSSILEDLRASGERCERLCCCGNTAMTDIFLDRDVRGLCAAPLHLSHTGNIWVELQGLPPIYIPPLIAPFLGSDVSCGIHALRLRQAAQPWLLIDLGTNAEFALAVHGRLFLASIPLGPAMEGIGMRCGQVAGPNVITSFSLAVSGLVAHRLPPCGACEPAKGISASGYLSLLALLRRIAVLDYAGHFVRSHPMPIAQKILRTLSCDSGRAILGLPGGVLLDALDIEACLALKAAFTCALTLLCRAANVSLTSCTVYLAGALGEHCALSDLIALGFFPEGTEKVVQIGNSALEGACDLAVHPWHAASLHKLCAQATVLELTEDPGFQKLFVQSMHFTSGANM